MFVRHLIKRARLLVGGAVLVTTLLVSAVVAQQSGPAYELRVDGLACPFCAYGVEKQLSKIAGVEGIDVDISAGTVTILMAHDAELDESTARQAVDDSGFSLRGFRPLEASEQ